MGIFDKLTSKKKSESKKDSSKKAAEKKIGVDKGKKKLVAKKEKKAEQKPRKNIHQQSRAYYIVTKGLITEKGTYLNAENKYLFEVDRQANKNDVREAIEDIYGIKPVKVNIVNLPGKERTYGKSKGLTSPRKKAIVTLPAGQTIQIHEGV